MISIGAGPQGGLREFGRYNAQRADSLPRARRGRPHVQGGGGRGRPPPPMPAAEMRRRSGRRAAAPSPPVPRP